MASVIENSRIIKIINTVLPTEVIALTFGPFIMFDGKADHVTVNHESIHCQQYMETLSSEGKKSTRIWALNPEYVKKNVGESNVLCRASCLSSFGCNSDFFAGRRYVLNNYMRVCGVSSEIVAEGDVGKKNEDPVSNAYGLILDPNNKQNALSLMTPERAAGLSGLVAEYLALQAQKQ